MKRRKRILQTGFSAICLAAAIAVGAVMPDLVFRMTLQEEKSITSHALDALELSLTYNLSVYDKMHIAASCMEPKSANDAVTVSTEAQVDFAMRYYIDRLVQNNYWISGVETDSEIHLNYIEPALYFVDETETKTVVFWSVGISLFVEGKYFYIADLVIDDETLSILSVQIETLIPGTGSEYADQSDMEGFAYSIQSYMLERDETAVWMENDEKYQPYYNGNYVHYAYMEAILLARVEDEYYRFFCSITPDGMYFNRTYEGYETDVPLSEIEIE